MKCKMCSRVLSVFAGDGPDPLAPVRVEGLGTICRACAAQEEDEEDRLEDEWLKNLQRAEEPRYPEEDGGYQNPPKKPPQSTRLTIKSWNDRPR